MKGGMRFWCALGVLLLAWSGVGVAIASHGRRAALNPQTYGAPAGRFELKVDPSHRDGRGEGTYTFSHDGKVKWSTKLPFTLWEAGVTDEGMVCGYAYTGGIDGFGKIGEFVVVIFDADGKVKLQESHKRVQSRFIHGPTDPISHGLMVDGVNDRLIVRVGDPDLNRGQESWWIYEISSAKAIRKITPAKLMKEAEKARSVHNAKVVAGTPLVLVHWWCYDEDSRDVGARYTLVDSEGKPVWRIDLPKDYLAGGNKAAQHRLRELLREKGGILASDKPGRFEIFAAEKSERVAFQLELASGNWSVKEISRAAYAFDAPEGQKPLVAPEWKLVDLGVVELKSDSSGTDGQGSELQRIDGVAVDSAGNIYAADERTRSVHVFDQAGKAKFVCELRPEDSKGQVFFPSFAMNERGDVFIRTGDELGGLGEERAFAHFSADGKQKGQVKLPGRHCCVPPGGNRFVVERYEEVCLCDETGKITRRIERGADGKWLEYIDGIECGPDGTIAILTDGFVNLYDAKGEPIRTIALPEAVGPQARFSYDSERIVVAGECGMLLFDKLGAVTANLIAREWKDTRATTSSVYFTPFLVSGGKELLVFEANAGVLRRYGMP